MMKDDPHKSFAEVANEKQANLFSEFIQFLRQEKKYWLIPVLLVLLGLGAIIILGSSTAAVPFIYKLF